MDKFIDWFTDRPVTQQILITAGICAFLLFLIGASYLLTNPKPSGKTSNTVSNNNNSPSLTPETTSNQPPNTAWQIYATDTFQISYPQNLSGVPGVISGGGSAFVLSGKESLTDYDIEIQVTDSVQTPVSNIYEIFRGFGYKEEETTLKNIITKKFSGNIAGLREIALVFENRGRVYKIQLSYQSSGQNIQIDQMFNSIISTFALI